MRRRSYGLRWAWLRDDGRLTVSAYPTRADAEVMRSDNERIVRVEILAAPTTKRKARKP